MTEAQIKALEKKLSQAIASRAELETNVSNQATLFVNFINKLSGACKGIDLELDNKLANFRSLSKKSIALEEIEIKIDEISKILQGIATQNDSQSDQLHSMLMQAGKDLQKSKGMDPTVRRELREFINENEDKKDTVIQYIAPLNQVVQFYRLVFSDQATGASSAEKPTYIADSKSLDFEASRDLVIHTLTAIKLTGKVQEKLNNIIHAIKTSDSAYAVFELLLQVFDLLALDLKRERTSAKSFISTISKALSSVKTKVNLTIETAASSTAKNEQLNDALNSHLSAMVAYLDSTDDIDAVKTNFTTDLATMGRLFEDKIVHEKTTATDLTEQLNAMKARVAQLEEESLDYEQRLQKQIMRSMQDALTKLGNRAAFDEYFAKQMVKFNASPFDLAIVVIDLDDFKRINDTYGHTAGDKTLQVIANTMKKQVPKDVFVGRYGGEEFVLIFKGVNAEKLGKLLNDLRVKIALLPFTFKQNKVSMTTSIGFTHIKVGDNVHQAFERADNALYQSKNQGKNQVTYFE